MVFYYRMHGDTVETLVIVVKTASGKESIQWSLSGSQVNAWNRGCVHINITEKYQVTDLTIEHGVTCESKSRQLLNVTLEMAKYCISLFHTVKSGYEFRK